VNLTRLVQNARMGDSEIVELLKIANGYLPRAGLEYDRVNGEINSTRAELNSWKAAVSNEVRVYQQFIDRNVALKKREDELQLSISELERKETRFNESLSEFQENDDTNLEVKEEEVISMINVLTQ
jgi:serine phosphatase RsbU (regulator of sigma subunit)